MTPHDGQIVTIHAFSNITEPHTEAYTPVSAYAAQGIRESPCFVKYDLRSF